VPEPKSIEPPFDPRWLDGVASSCRRLHLGAPQLLDLYFERRLELRVRALDGTVQLEESRAEGSAARWRFHARSVLHARTGVSRAVVAELVARHAPQVELPEGRAVPPTELDPPRGWREWASELADRLRPGRPTVIFLARRAAVLRAGVWAPISAPDLVRVHLAGETNGALLAVWPHPQLAHWLRELATPPPRRRWSPPSGHELPVLFAAGTAGALMHELLGHLTESDLVSTGASPLAGLAGSSLAPATLEVTDDPTRPDLPGAFSCDDEGVSAQPQPLLRGGVLVGWLCDRLGAGRLASPPGRGRRGAWSRPPTPRLSNLVVDPGTTPPEALERDLRHGLVVTRVAGASVDPISARAVIRVERGFEVVRGRRTRPLAPCALTGGVLELLTRIDPTLGSDPAPEWRLGWCVKGGAPMPTGSLAPTLLVHRLEVL
jgi:hypothetical protein